MAEPRLYFYFLSDPSVGYDFEKANATEAQIVKVAVLVSTPGEVVMRAPLQFIYPSEREGDPLLMALRDSLKSIWDLA